MTTGAAVSEIGMIHLHRRLREAIHKNLPLEPSAEHDYLQVRDNILELRRLIDETIARPHHPIISLLEEMYPAEKFEISAFHSAVAFEPRIGRPPQIQLTLEIKVRRPESPINKADVKLPDSVKDHLT